MTTKITSFFLSSVFICIFLTACTNKANKLHPLEGAWEATDGTLFYFRPDKTFHGYDYKEREIWGSWVILSENRIGFQSLLHDSFYRPQYAIIETNELNKMNYIVTGGTKFIEAKRIIDESEALKAIERVIAPQIHIP